MIRNLLATTAVATLISTGAIAQTTTPAQPVTQDPAATMQQQDAPMQIKAEGNLASNIIGEEVYNGTGDDAENIGEVNDLVIGKDGSIQAVVIGVGGFLGIGQKDVAIEYNLVEWVDRDDDRWMVVETTADALKAQQEFDRLAYQPMPADANVAETKPATAEDLANAPVENDDEAEGDVATVPADGATTTETETTAAAPANDAATADNQNMAAAPAEETAPAAEGKSNPPRAKLRKKRPLRLRPSRWLRLRTTRTIWKPLRSTVRRCSRSTRRVCPPRTSSAQPSMAPMMTTSARSATSCSARTARSMPSSLTSAASSAWAKSRSLSAWTSSSS